MMMFAVPAEPYHVEPVVRSALNKLLILHADHEQNCSTTTVRTVGSGGANLFASISAGVCALWGPLHGGANQAVIEMLEEIRADGANYRKYVDLTKSKESSFKLMGFGHRVYKNFDPRAKILVYLLSRAADPHAFLGLDDPSSAGEIPAYLLARLEDCSQRRRVRGSERSRGRRNRRRLRRLGGRL